MTRCVGVTSCTLVLVLSALWLLVKLNDLLSLEVLVLAAVVRVLLNLFVDVVVAVRVPVCFPVLLKVDVKLPVGVFES